MIIVVHMRYVACGAVSLHTVMLSDQDDNVLDMKTVSFKTFEGCVYCPAGQCDCNVRTHTCKTVQAFSL